MPKSNDISNIEQEQSAEQLLRTGQLNEKELACGDCGAPMKLRTSKYGLFYGCTRWPKCQGTHGAHSEGSQIGKPYGTPANAKTREWRRKAHKSFDQYWRNKGIRRQIAYSWLTKRMGLVNADGQPDKHKCHIGLFTINQCKQVICICRKEI